MAFSQRLEIRQGHALVMTPQLMQAIKLLQLSSLGPAAYVENELETNPLLEKGSEDHDTVTEAPEPPHAAQNGADGEAIPKPDLDADHQVDDGAAQDTDAASSRDNREPSPAENEWSRAERRQSEDGDYNLE